MKSSLKAKIWLLLSFHVRVLEWIYTRQLPKCQGTPCWKQERSLSDSNGIQNLVKWLNVDLRTKPLWVRIQLLSHNKYEKIFRSTTGIILWSTELYFFSILSQNMILLPWAEKSNTLEAFTGISFFNVYKILLCKFCVRSLKSIKM